MVHRLLLAATLLVKQTIGIIEADFIERADFCDPVVVVLQPFGTVSVTADGGVVTEIQSPTVQASRIESVSFGSVGGGAGVEVFGAEVFGDQHFLLIFPALLEPLDHNHQYLIGLIDLHGFMAGGLSSAAVATHGVVALQHIHFLEHSQAIEQTGVLLGVGVGLRNL